MAYQIECLYMYNTTNTKCNETCVDNFYKGCPKYYCGIVANETLHCPVNEKCFISSLIGTIDLLNTRGMCENLRAGQYTMVSVYCGQYYWIKIRIWIDKSPPSCKSLSSSVSFAQCKCTYCHVCASRYVDFVYCSCKAADSFENSSPSNVTTTTSLTRIDITSPETTSSETTSPEITSCKITSPETTSPKMTSSKITSPEIGSPEIKSFENTLPGVKSRITDKTPIFTQTTLAARNSYNSGVTEGAIGGGFGLLLLVLFMVFVLWFRKRRTKKSKTKISNTQLTAENRMYNARNGSLSLSPEENHTVPRDYDYVDSVMTDDVQPQPDPENKNNFILDPTEVTRHQETTIQGISYNEHENVSRASQQNNRDNAKDEESDYNTLNHEGSAKPIDSNDDHYQHVKMCPNSNGQDDYDELAHLFEKQKIYPAEDDYDHCKIPSRRHDDDEGDYDHLN